jgi:hypothetical protein
MPKNAAGAPGAIHIACRAGPPCGLDGLRRAR